MPDGPPCLGLAEGSGTKFFMEGLALAGHEAFKAGWLPHLADVLPHLLSSHLEVGEAAETAPRGL